MKKAGLHKSDIFLGYFSFFFSVKIAEILLFF